MNYDGGKNGCFRNIVNQMPPHDLFVEGFGGSAAVTFFKRPAAESFVIEINPDVAAAAQSRITARTTEASAGGDNCQIPKFLVGDVRRWLGPDSWLRNELTRAGKRALCYFDPPYLLSSRSSGRLLYENEFHTEAEHTALLKLIRALGCHVIISHYRCPLYDARLRSWRRVDFRTGSRGGLKIESLYCNFPDPAVLHDYRFAGANKDRRQRLKRRIQTLLAELDALPAVEANALRAAVAAWGNCATGAAVEKNCHRGQSGQPTGAGTRSA